MGLDMYLNARKFIWTQPKEGRSLGREKLKNVLKKAGEELIGEVNGLNCEALYWRKANAIHGWFVDNVQKGEDDCGEYAVSKEQIEALRDVCGKALEEKNMTDEPSALKTRAGFFFGETEYDEWFWNDVQRTFDVLNKILAREDLDDWEFYYHASW